MVDSFSIKRPEVTRFGVVLSVLAGLWGGSNRVLTEYYTSHTYKPVREVADASKTGAATNIYGLSLGISQLFFRFWF